MIQIISTTQIVLSIVLIILILVQNKNSSISIMTGGSQNAGKFERRGPEKFLHNLTIAVGVLFTVFACVFFLLG